MNKTLNLTLLISLFLFASSCKPDIKPNIILIMSDDMGISDIGCYGSEIPTPNLDRLAMNGIRFTQFYNTARCCPTRASLLTGLHPHQTGIGAMTSDNGVDGYRGDLNSNCVTIAEVLKTAGYQNYMAGKWHVTRYVGPDDSNHNWPLQRGFDEFYGTITGAGSYFDPVTLCRGNTYITPENDPEYQPEVFYYTDAITDNAIRFLRGHDADHKGSPFFLYMAYTAAHWPMHALPEDIVKFDGWYDGGYDKVREERWKRMIELGIIDPETALSPAVWNWDERPNQRWESDMMEVYAAMIHSMDRGIGKVINELEEQGQLENTLILFLQDNGACAENWLNDISPEVYDTMKFLPLGRDGLQKKIWPPMQTRDGRPVIAGSSVLPGGADTYPLYDIGWANTSNTPFRFYKHYIHEGGISTPLIAHWPENITKIGELRSQYGQLPDIMATIVDVSGAEYPVNYDGQAITPMEGVSLAPVFQDQTITHPPLFWEHIGKQGARDGDWKIVAQAGRVFPIPIEKWELYNIRDDRSELNNLADQMPDKVIELAQLWEDWAIRAKVVPYK
jgi:arylsulfatase A-like enzyme